MCYQEILYIQKFTTSTSSLTVFLGEINVSTVLCNVYYNKVEVRVLEFWWRDRGAVDQRPIRTTKT